jgi:hypothetical protein
METKDPISIQDQAQQPENTNLSTPAASNDGGEQKLSAADIILQKLQAHKQQSLEQIISEVSQENVANAQQNSNVAEEQDNDASETEEKNDHSELDVDYAAMTKEQLVEALENIVKRDDVAECKSYVDYIKTLFYKRQYAEIAEEREKFVAAGNNENDFRATPDPLEEKFKLTFDLYREKRNKYNEQIEQEKLNNLNLKKEIVSKIENLVNSQETLNQTFEEFKALQKQWREIGLVPQAESKKLWDSYNYQVERFYDFVKINKELRDLDLKKNTEQKIALCEKAEELLLESKVVKAFNELQKLHEQWKEIGPTFPANKEELWERFKKATDIINKKHQDYYANIKKEQESNYKAKMLICEKAEEIIEPNYNSRSEWDAKNKEILELQQIWKMIGFAPKKYNTAIYERFRSACDKFFEKKREFYAQHKEEEDNNLQLKEDLCVQAEGLKDSTDWKKTTEILKDLQAKWKTIGPVSRKYSEDIWQRFRAACNTFFDNKQKYFKSIDAEQHENLKLKEALIEEVKNFAHTGSDEQNIAALKEIQKRWSQIGLVPISKKDSVYERFRSAIDAQFAKINIDEAKRSEMRVKTLIESNKDNPQAFEKLRAEREKIKGRLESIQQQLTLSENNLGFFAKSRNAESMIEGFKKKLEKSKMEAEQLKKLINMLNKAISELPKKGEKKN